MKKLKFIIVVIGAISIFVFFQNQKYTTKENVYEDSFNGVVQKVEYSKRERPTVTLNNRSYGLNAFGVYRYNKIEVGDSLVKSIDSPILFHFKSNENGKQVLFDTYNIK